MGRLEQLGLWGDPTELRMTPDGEGDWRQDPGTFKTPPPRSRLLWIGVDLDGTLAAPVWTADNPTADIGEPIAPNVAKVRSLAADGWKIVVHTSRAWTDYEAIEGWLIHHGIPFREVQCGKPLYAAYCDDRAIRADAPNWHPNKVGGHCGTCRCTS